MKIPKTLKIGGHIYKISFPHRFQERGDIVGLHIKQTSEIMITNSDDTGNHRTQARIYVSLIHEVLHAIEDIFGQNILEKNKNIDEEKIINIFAEGIFSVLVDNGYLKLEERGK